MSEPADPRSSELLRMRVALSSADFNKVGGAERVAVEAAKSDLFDTIRCLLSITCRLDSIELSST